MEQFFDGFEKQASTRMMRELAKTMYPLKGQGPRPKDWASNKMYQMMKRKFSDLDTVKSRRKSLNADLRMAKR